MNQLSSSPFALVVNAQGYMEKRVLRLGVQTLLEVEVISGVTERACAVAANLSSFTPGEAACAE